MTVSAVMTKTPLIVQPDDTLQSVANKMCELDIGFLPVSDGDHQLGLITDRDIALYAVARGKSPDARVGEFMSQDILYCFDDEDVDAVMKNMAQVKLRPTPVVNRAKRLVGIVSLADAALNHKPASVGGALTGIAHPGGAHPQSPKHAKASYIQ
jgi:CBS domain-containing protein